MLGNRAHRRWWLITRCAARRLKGDNIPLLAAGVAFYGFLALFPMLIAAALAYGLVADPEDVGPHLDAVADALPSEAEAVITDELESITAASNGAIGLGLVGAAIGGLWTVTTGMKGLITATNVAYERRETRSFVRLRVLGAGLAVASIGFGLVATTLVAVVPAVADAIGIGTQNRILVELLRWPLLAGLILVALAAIYRIGPDRPDSGFRLLSLGAITGSLVWIAADVGFSVYVDNFSRYANTYGSLAGVVVLMLWLYVSAFIVLLGAEINAEAERFDQREVGRVANSKDDRGREE